ncbi:endonuclease domain-containing protein [Streptosporangium sp. G11]|uniref:endonuclease domain-containing protein n=1 Tax=Streptosporangium sp. G11 TaxID=3436926 RepID=UPI003EC10A67
MAQSWAELPTCHVVWVREPDSAIVTPSADALPAGFPAIFGYVPTRGRTVRETVADVLRELERTVVSPATEGRPHPAGFVESALERALGAHGWAAGRAWNQTYRPHPPADPIRVDLLWRDERCLVEFDGPEHRHPGRLAEDRLRDARLTKDGYAVLRFTNERVMADMPAVLRELKRFLPAHRDTCEG